tara:strand:- start:1206 stop:1772 length:567 start_codon:yes stop_codon:yes gene_type:complete
MDSDNIIKTYPKLTKFQVEYEGNPYDCNRCMGKGQCCGAQNDLYSDQMACQKCRCQNLHDTLDGSRNEKVSQFGCEDCDDSQFSQIYCQNLGLLNNNLKANITDCSNNFLNLGSNATITDVELRTECNIGGERSVSIFNTEEEEELQRSGEVLVIPEELGFINKLPIKSLLIGGVVGILILIIVYLFT